MMKYIFFTIVFFYSILSASTSIDKKIHKTSSQLHSYKKNYVDINKKLKRTADAILKQTKELKKQMKILKQLKEDLASKETSYKSNIKKLKELRDAQYKLKQQQDKIEERLVLFIAKTASLSMVLEDKYSSNEESVIQFEVLKKMLKSSQATVKKLNGVFYLNQQKVDMLKKHDSILETNISKIDKKRKRLVEITKANKLALIKLKKEKDSYTKQLKRVIKRQNSLATTLEKLNLVKKNKIERERQRRERAKAFKRQKVNLNANLPNVIKHGSSYQSIETIKYNGRKTRAPLDRYTITKKYGPYVDPIYGIKIFNESISLRPKSPNAKVKNVMNGKVIYADSTAVLNNIVIVEHNHGLHTIYANLSKIAPNIKKGRKIRRGAVVGRVRDELIFEVTQKSYHINPIHLFR